MARQAPETLIASRRRPTEDRVAGIAIDAGTTTLVSAVASTRKGSLQVSFSEPILSQAAFFKDDGGRLRYVVGQGAEKYPEVARQPKAFLNPDNRQRIGSSVSGVQTIGKIPYYVVNTGRFGVDSQGGQGMHAGDACRGCMHGKGRTQVGKGMHAGGKEGACRGEGGACRDACMHAWNVGCF